jgi:predicted PurR-regulated permease PerM
MQEKKIGNTFFFILLFFSLYLGYLMFAPFLDIIMFSVLIVIVVNPVHQKIRKQVRNDNSASFLSTFFVFLFVLIPGSIFVAFLINELINLIPAVTAMVKETKDFNYYIQNIPVVGSLYGKLRTAFISSGIDYSFNDFASKYFSSIATFIIDKGKSLFTNIGLFIAAMLFVLMTIFFLFRDGPIFYKSFYEIIPLTEREKTFLFNQSYIAVKAIFMGTVLTAAAQALLGLISYLALGLNFSIFWAFATFITAFIPLGGAALVWGPLAIYCFFVKGYIYGIGLLIWGAFGISGVDNILRPFLIGGKTNINTLVMVFAILGGIQVFGFIGIFIAPVIIVLISNLLTIYQERFTRTIIIDAFDDPPGQGTLNPPPPDALKDPDPA